MRSCLCTAGGKQRRNTQKMGRPACARTNRLSRVKHVYVTLNSFTRSLSCAFMLLDQTLRAVSASAHSPWSWRQRTQLCHKCCPVGWLKAHALVGHLVICRAVAIHRSLTCVGYSRWSLIFGLCGAHHVDWSYSPPASDWTYPTLTMVTWMRHMHKPCRPPSCYRDLSRATKIHRLRSIPR